MYAVKLVWNERSVGDWEQEEGGGGNEEEETADINQQFLFVRFVP